MVRILLKAGADINAQQAESGRTILLRSIEKRRFDIVRTLLDNRVDVNFPKDDPPILHAASLLPGLDVEMLTLFIDAGANVNARNDSYDQTALLVSAANASPLAVELLIHAKADVNAADNNARQALHEAARIDIKGNGIVVMPDTVYSDATKIANLLIANGARINDRDSLNKQTPLHIAVRHADETCVDGLGVVKALIKAGAALRLLDARGGTAAHEAAAVKHVDLLRALVTSSEAANVVGGPQQNGHTLIHSTIRFSRAENLKFLLDMGAAADEPDDSGNSPIHYFARKDESTEMVDMLIAANANVNKPDGSSNTALHIAIEQKQTVMVRHLLWKGADATARDENGMTAFQLAVRMRNAEIVQILIEDGGQSGVERAAAVDPEGNNWLEELRARGWI
jgi:ankyrin repeat protein